MPKKLEPGRYRGLYLEVTRATKTRHGTAVEKGYLLLALSDPIDGWIVVLYKGGRDAVKRSDVLRLAPPDLSLVKSSTSFRPIRRRKTKKKVSRRSRSRGSVTGV